LEVSVSLFTCLIEGQLTSSPELGATREGRPYVQFRIIHRARYRNAAGTWTDAKPMHFDIVCWGPVAEHVRDLVRGDQVVVEASRIMAFFNDSDEPDLKLSAANVSISMRFTQAHTGSRKPSRPGDIIVTPDGERYDANTYPEVITDRELIHH
jgi:single-stranded DNA-binding protein